MNERRVCRIWGIVMTVALITASVRAAPPQTGGVVAGSTAGPPPDAVFHVMAGPGLGRFEFVEAMGGENKVVTGAPFSADESTENIQVLADGNRITRQESGKIYRDSQGRRREERTLSMVGPWSASGTPPHMITIFDPVAGARYVLNEQEKTAFKMPLSGKAGIATQKMTVTSSGAAVTYSGAGEAHTKPQVQRAEESLGTQAIEGLGAQGTRTTETIPAGAIGNEKPIVSVSERWYAPDLQIYLLTKHSDPRFGEMTHKLTDISREEPAADLFQVPADYTVKDAPPGRAFFKRELPPPK